MSSGHPILVPNRRIVAFAASFRLAIECTPKSMPRIVGDDPTLLPAALRRVKPRTVLLREGLDVSHPHSYLVFEEEVPRAGTRIFQSYQRTRGWDDRTTCGRVWNWLRIQRQNGRGEGSSGLLFDQLTNVAFKK